MKKTRKAVTGIRPTTLLIPLAVFIVTAAGPTSTALAGRDAEFEEVRRSLVKVYTRSNPPDVRNPWQKLGITSTSGSGVVIEGNRILTNAHVVANQVNVEVKREGTTRRFEAGVEYVGHDCDLAILSVDDKDFFEGAVPVKLGTTSLIRDSVTVYGFPLGGETISVTEGIVSRIEVSRYAHSRRPLLLVQIDAAINPGNSGGPVISGGKMVGIAAQSIRSAENVGFMVPASVIDHFFEDVRDGRFDGFPSLGVTYQAIENPSLRRALGLADGETGVLVTGVNFGSSANGTLRAGDVLLRIDGIPVAEDLSVPWRENNRLHFGYLIQSKQVGDRATLSILRDGRRIEEVISLRDEADLVPRPGFDVPPSYYIFGGLVFQPLSVDYLRLFKHMPPDFSYYVSYRNLKTAERRQVVLLSKVLATPLTRGYQGWQDAIVNTVQGEVPRDLPDLVRIIESSADPWLRIEAESGRVLVLDLQEAASKTTDVLGRYGIPEDRSEDLKQETGDRRRQAE
ncbi:MAG: trypsin-like peptidase domain-containing protein [bacterium]|nr:MAG: trypsin-like peptidase domain-containing protein [bacterium]